MRLALGSCLGINFSNTRGLSASNSWAPESLTTWSDPKMFVPELIQDLERLIAMASSAIVYSEHTRVYGLHDELLRYRGAKRKRSGLLFRGQDIPKSMGVQGTTLGSVTTGVTFALHYSAIGEKPELTTRILLTLATNAVALESECDRFRGRLMCCDRGYFTEEMEKAVVAIGMGVLGTVRRGARVPVSYGRTFRPRPWQPEQLLMPTRGFSEAAMFHNSRAGLSFVVTETTGTRRQLHFS
jgi:hypothetical protein